MTTNQNQKAPRPEIEYRGIIIRTFEVPCTPYVWRHDELDGGGTAETLEEAQAQIDRHMHLVERALEDEAMHEAFTSMAGCGDDG